MSTPPPLPHSADKQHPHEEAASATPVDIHDTFAVLFAELSYTKQLLHELVDRLLLTQDEDGDINYDAVNTARKRAIMEWNITYETHGRSGQEYLDIRRKFEAEYANPTV